MSDAELIARLDAATEGSAELDQAISICLTGQGESYRPCTRNIDSALTLLPGWASFELTRSAAGSPTFTRCRLWDWRRSPLMSDPGNEWKSEGNRPLPINICIASFLIRAACSP
jgi:hypothetical protein